ncbi:hypothetical protein BJY01DRAFT_251740 [Aspergillus pseudoustus]|uniref:Uncharacterized protein n=1 Tax=Aspergillus pseudoustus TaxID=1810923 RepID=A0ABR4JA78_9EURO
MSNPRSQARDPYSSSNQAIGDDPPRHSYQYPSGDTTAETQEQPPFANMSEQPHVGQKDEFEHSGQDQAKYENMGTAEDYASGFKDGNFYTEDQDQGRIRGKIQEGWE